MADKLDVKQGTLALMILRTLEVLGPLHGYGIARRIEETSRNRLALNYGTLYPALLKLEPSGASRRTIAAPSTTPSPRPGRSRSRVRPASGTRPPT